jgi:hypothetical protein
MLEKKKVKWLQQKRKIIHQNGGESESVELNNIDQTQDFYNNSLDNSFSLECDNKTGEYFWVKGKGIEPHSAYRESSNNKYVFN